MFPKSLHRDMLRRVHYVHSGVVSTLSLARETIAKGVIDRKQPKEALVPHEVLDRSWAKVGDDLFPYRGRNYLICDDYYSSF